MRLLFSFVFCITLIPLSGEAQSTNKPDDTWRRNAPVTSHLKNVVVVGMPKEVALGIAVWAESVIEDLQDWAQSPIPGSYVYPLVIGAETREQEKQGFVMVSQQLTEDGHMRQSIVVVNPTLVEREELLESLCQLLLNRWIHACQTKESLYERPGRFPQWFTCGIAQSMYPDLMNRNRQMIVREEEKGNYRSALSVVSHPVLPPGRWPEKAHAGLVMKWIGQQVDPSAFITEAACSVANNNMLDEAFLLQQLNIEEARDFNAEWDLWMARQETLLVPGLSAGDTEELSRVLEMRAKDLGLAHPAIPPNGIVPPMLLIEERNQQWAMNVSRIMVWRLQLESVGKMQSIRDSIEPFLEFFNLILMPPKEITRTINKNKTKVAKPPSTRMLKKAWKKAERGWRKLIENSTDRAAYLDVYDQPEAVSTNAVNEWLNQWQSQNL